MSKVEQIRKEIERRKEILSNIQTSDSEVANFYEGKAKAYNEVFELIDSLDDKCDGCNNVKGCVTCVDGSEWAHYEDPVSGDLGEYINELSKQFPEVSFAKLSRIAVRVAKWGMKQAEVKIQAQSMALAHGCPKESISDDLEEAANAYIHNESNWIHPRTETFKAGAQWQKQQLLDKACEWLNLQLNLPSDFEKHFREAMEE